MVTRRNFLGMLAAPAIIRTTGLLMPVKKIVPVYEGAVTGRWSSLDVLPPGAYTGRIVHFAELSVHDHPLALDVINKARKVIHMTFQLDNGHVFTDKVKL